MAKGHTQNQLLSKEQIAYEKKFMKGFAPLNIGALFLPPIWGPAHGFWITILFYPLWMFADNTFYAAYSQPSPLSICAALVVGVVLTLVTFVFARLAQPAAAHKYIEQRKVPKDVYLRRQRIWAIVCVLVGLIMLGAATYFNLAIRPTLVVA